MEVKVKILLKERKFAHRLFITGFHGIGFVGSLTVEYLVKKLKAKRIGYIITKRLPPYVSLENDTILLPFELYNANDIVFLRCNVPMSLGEMYYITRAVAEWVIKREFEEAILIGGLDNRLKTSEEDKLRLAPTKAFLAKFKDKVRGKLLEEGLYIVGPLALLLAFFEMKDFPALTILPYASVERVDPLAASIAIQYLNDVYGLRVDVSELEERGLEIEKRILERKKRIEEMLKSTTRLYYV